MCLKRRTKVTLRLVVLDLLLELVSWTLTTLSCYEMTASVLRYVASILELLLRATMPHFIGDTAPLWAARRRPVPVL